MTVRTWKMGMKYLVIEYYAAGERRPVQVEEVFGHKLKREAEAQFDWARREEGTVRVEMFQRVHQAYGLIKEWNRS